MRLRNFILGYALVPALLLFALPHPTSQQQNRYSHVLDLTDTGLVKTGAEPTSHTRIISPAALVPGTWDAAQIPAERLIGPLIVLDLNSSSAHISVDDIAAWEAKHGHVPLGAIIAVRITGSTPNPASDAFPLSADAVQFLVDARYTRGFLLEIPVNIGSDRMLSRQIALHGNYVVEGLKGLAALPETGSLVIVAPGITRNLIRCPVRVLAMVG